MNPEYALPWQHLWQRLQVSVPDSPSGPGQRFCRQCRTALPLFVSDELAGRPVDRLYPDVAYHLDACPQCLAEYEMLSLLMETTSNDSEVLA
jgi:hypothetical protein